MHRAVVVDIGGTHIRFGFVSGNGEVCQIRKEPIRHFMTTPHSTDIVSAFCSRIAEFISEFGIDLSWSAPVVVSFPGPIEAGSRILAAPTLLGFVRQMPDILQELQRSTSREVHLLNDVSAAAWRLSKTIASTIDRFIVVTISSGIGTKVFIRPYGVFDHEPFSGEIGHIVVDRSNTAMMCDCGEPGHLGAVASGRGIERVARRRAQLDGESFARSSCATNGATTATLNNEEHFIPALLSGDSWARDVLQTCLNPLAEALAPIIVACGLQKAYIIGGFATAAGDVIKEVLLSRLNSILGSGPLAPTLTDFIHVCEDGVEMCLQGAGVYAESVIRKE